MRVKPSDFRRLTKDTVDNKIIKCMMRGWTSTTIDQRENHMGRCHDETKSEEKIVEDLRKRGFEVRNLVSDMNGDGEYVHVGYNIVWGEEDES